jgi:uncharacterized protein
MRIVIIGGRGFIGSALSKELADAGHEVSVTTRGEGGLEGERKLVHWNGTDRTSLTAILENCDAVVNLAGENIGAKPWTKTRKQQLRESRILTTNALVEAINAMKKRPTILIQASAVGYYGTSDREMEEISPAGSDWLAQLGRDWEAPLHKLKEAKTRVVVIRSGVVLAQSDSVLQKLALPVRFFIGGPLGNGKQWISWIHLGDEVRAIRFLLETSKCAGVYNLTSPEPVQNMEMEKKIASRIHRPYWLPAPAFLLRAALGEMSTIVLHGQRVLPRRLLEAGYKFKFAHLDDALKDLL